MASERKTQTQTAQQAPTNSEGEALWADLEVMIPNDRDDASIVALVECALVELAHEHVGAVVVAQQVWRTKRTQYVAVDDVGERFQKRHFDDRLGWHETTVSRQTMRDEFVTWLTRLPSGGSGSAGDGETTDPDRFTVKSTHGLQQPSPQS